MNKLIVTATTALWLIGIAAPANAFCVTGDANQGCARPFGSSESSKQSDDETTHQGFDAQTGNQWSTTSHKMGDVTFYNGFSSGNSWDNHQRVFGSGFNGPGFSSQNQANGPRCAFYGAC